MRFFFVFLFSTVFLACTSEKPTHSEQKKLKKEQFTGETMGTTLSISYLDSSDMDFSIQLSDLLIDINNAVSTYIQTSEISIFNHEKDSLYVALDGHFARNYNLAKQVYQQTDGWFNPSVMPLVNYWGFGYTEKKMVAQIDSATLTNLVQLVQFDSITVQNSPPNQLLVTKKIKGLELDFSAIAKGDAVDQLGLLLESLGIHNYFVEIGGEVRARGTTMNGFHWRTGIRSPRANSTTKELQVAVQLQDLSLATSGNYENYYEDKNTGMKYAHTINPKTGYPEKNQLLSASVFAPDCSTADAFATAFMAMGLDKAFALASELPELEAYFIYSAEDGTLKIKHTPKVTEFMDLGKQ
ncbi:MAG: Thiamin biosynthesis lipoprotein ApbE [uncultured Aureispira sp.]|uniref:FAD:protein FMN transferase n=1 Tax=uncultured Aureispira sp. TaxID=1331704 RepID=A0A6S6TTK7_9BACT|nr:MAG: Thiamin biosynthesis lipoprotein ApbE [uncultured Aureispira sp.]